MSDDRIKKGMLAKSKAGHDKGKIYVIYDQYGVVAQCFGRRVSLSIE